MCMLRLCFPRISEISGGSDFIEAGKQLRGNLFRDTDGQSAIQMSDRTRWDIRPRVGKRSEIFINEKVRYNSLYMPHVSLRSITRLLQQ